MKLDNKTNSQLICFGQGKINITTIGGFKAEKKKNPATQPTQQNKGWKSRDVNFGERRNAHMPSSVQLERTLNSK